MEMNVGIGDAVIRFFVAIFVIIIAVFLQSIVIGILGIIIFLTGLTGICPIYNILGRSTREKNH